MLRKSLLLVPPLMLALTASVSATDDGAAAKKVRLVRVETDLRSIEEVPAISSFNASGHFKAILDEENLTITYELSYEGLEGAPLAGHVHVGQSGVNGNIPLFLCANAPALAPAGVPVAQACPPAPATITGVLTPENTIPRPTQGIGTLTNGVATATNEDFVELMRLMKAGVMYANVHSTLYTGGEIRGQIKRDLIPDLKDLIKDR